MFVTELDHPGDFNTTRSERPDGRGELRHLTDQVVPDVFVRYVRWRVSHFALSLMPLARAADVALYVTKAKGRHWTQSLDRMARAGLWLAGRVSHEVGVQTVRQYRVLRVRSWLLRRIVVAQGQQWAASAGRPVHAAAWLTHRITVEARARAHRRLRLHKAYVRLLSRALVVQAREHLRSAAERGPSPTQLRAALDRHEAWVASGWEVGKRVDLHRATLRGVKLDCALLADADLHGADLDRADLHEADLEGADLHQARLRRANLHAAGLRWADLRRADLSRADLEEADLKDADLQRANLRGARLSKAVLEHADLRGANLAKVKGLTQAQLDQAEADARTRLPRGLAVRSTSIADTGG